MEGAGRGISFSIVIPVHNEAGNIASLLREIGSTLDAAKEYEVICVDDGSDDRTLMELRRLLEEMPRLRILAHGERCGQSTALKTGVDAARREWIVTLDGDGQDDPASILILIDAFLHAGSSSVMVCGHRVNRQDDPLRRFSSRLARLARAILLGDSTPDAGCGLKFFSKKTFQELPFFDHMHRFLPALVQSLGTTVISVPVNHRPRAHGISHYGIGNRLWTTAADLLGVIWLKRRMRLRNIKEIEK